MRTTSHSADHRLAVWSASITFFSFAIPIAMLGIIWPDVRERFDQSLGALGFAALVYGLGRFSTALSGPVLTRWMGAGRSFIVVLLLLGTATSLMMLAPSWPVFLVGLALVGMMSGSLDSLGAGFITAVRDVGSAGLVHGSYGVGATLGPLLVVATPSWRVALASSALLVVAAAGFATFARDTWPTIAPPERLAVDRPPTATVLLSLGAFCAFVAVEVTAGQWAFTHLTETRGVGETAAAVGVSLYWGGITVGRLALVRPGMRTLVDRLRLARLAATAGLSMLSLAFLPPVLTIPALMLSGLALSPIVPSLFASTAHRVGESHAQRLAVWQLGATNLGAIGVPYLTGELVDAISPAVIVAVVAATAAVGTTVLTAIAQLPPRMPTASDVVRNDRHVE